MDQTASAALIASIVAVVLAALGLVGGVIGYVQGTAALRRATLIRQRASLAEEAALQAKAQAEQSARAVQQVLDRLNALQVRSLGDVADLPTGPLILPPRLIHVPQAFEAAPVTGPVAASRSVGPPPAAAAVPLTTGPSYFQPATGRRPVAPVTEATPVAAPVAGPAAVPPSAVPIAEPEPTTPYAPPIAEPEPVAEPEPQPVAATAVGVAEPEPQSVAEPVVEAPTEPEQEPTPPPVSAQPEPAQSGPAPVGALSAETVEPEPASARSATGQVTAGLQDSPPMDWAEALRTGAIPLPSVSRGTYAAPRKRSDDDPTAPVRFELRAVGRQRFEAVNVGGVTAEQATVEGTGDDSHLVRPAQTAAAPVGPGEALAFSVLRVEGRRISVRVSWLRDGGRQTSVDLPLP